MRVRVALFRHRRSIALALGAFFVITLIVLNAWKDVDLRNAGRAIHHRWLGRYSGASDNTGKTLVWVLTYPKTHNTSCKAIQKTWGRRVDKLLFMSSVNDSSVPTIGLQVKEGLRHLTIKTFAAYEYLYASELNHYDWFFKVDDDTFVIAENLRHFLSDKNPNSPVAFGLRMSRNDSGQIRDYLHGGSGYILSREAVRRYGLLHRKACVHWDIATEDIMLAWCLQRLNVSLLDTTDAYGNERFLYATPKRHALNQYLEVYRKHRVNLGNVPSEHGGISRYPVTFHKVGAQEMIELDTLLYRIQIHGT